MLRYAARASATALLLAACIENTSPADNDKSSSTVVEVDSGGPEPMKDSGPDETGDSGTSKVSGTGVDCVADSAQTPTSCYGFYCGTNEQDILAESRAGSPCGTEVQVSMICEGGIAVKVAECAIRNALEPTFEDFERGVTTCVRADEELDPVSDACLDCYIVSADCAKQECINECLPAPNGVQCSQCRQEAGCTPDFYKCAGLPDPI